MSIKEIAAVTLLGAAVLVGTAVATAQTHDHGTAAPPAASQQAPAMDHQKMMAMMADMQASQKKLDDLVAQMNTATGPEKVDRIAAVVNEMAAMHTRMTAMMQNGMMQGRGMMQGQQPAP